MAQQDEDEIEILFEQKSKRRTTCSFPKPAIPTATPSTGIKRKQCPIQSNHGHFSIPVDKLWFYHNQYRRPAGWSRKIKNSWSFNTSAANKQSRLLFLNIDLNKGIQFSHRPVTDQNDQIQNLGSSSTIPNSSRETLLPSFLPNSINLNQLVRIKVNKIFQESIDTQSVKKEWNSTTEDHQNDERLKEYQIRITYQQLPMAIRKVKEHGREIIVISSDDDEDEESCKKKVKNYHAYLLSDDHDDDDDKENVKEWAKLEDDHPIVNNMSSSTTQNGSSFQIECNVQLPPALREDRDIDVVTPISMDNEVGKTFNNLVQFVNHFNLDRVQFFHNFDYIQNQSHDHSPQTIREASLIDRVGSSEIHNNDHTTPKKFGDTINVDPNNRHGGIDKDLANQDVKNSPFFNSNMTRSEQEKRPQCDNEPEPNPTNTQNYHINTQHTIFDKDHDPMVQLKNLAEGPKVLIQHDEMNHHSTQDRIDTVREGHNTTPQTSPTSIAHPIPLNDDPVGHIVEERDENNHQKLEDNYGSKVDGDTPSNERSSSYDSLIGNEDYGQLRLSDAAGSDRSDDQHQPVEEFLDLDSNDEDALDFVDFENYDLEFTPPPSVDETNPELEGGNFSLGQNQTTNLVVDNQTPKTTVDVPAFTTTPPPPSTSTPGPDLEKDVIEQNAMSDFFKDSGVFQSHLLGTQVPIGLDDEMIMVNDEDDGKNKNSSSGEMEKGKGVGNDVNVVINDVINQVIEDANYDGVLSDQVPVDKSTNLIVSSHPLLNSSNQISCDTSLVADVDPQDITMSHGSHSPSDPAVTGPSVEETETPLLDIPVAFEPSTEEEEEELEVATPMDIPVASQPSTKEAEEPEVATPTDIPVSPGIFEKEGTTVPTDIPVSLGTFEEKECSTNPMDIPVSPDPPEENSDPPIVTMDVPGSFGVAADSVDAPMAPEGCQDATLDRTEYMEIDPTHEQEEQAQKEVISAALRDVDSDPEDENYKPRKMEKNNLSQSDNDDDDGDDTSSYTTDESSNDSDLEPLDFLDNNQPKTGPGPHSTNNYGTKFGSSSQGVHHPPFNSSVKSSNAQSGQHNLDLKNYFLQDYCKRVKERNDKLKKKYQDLKTKLNLNHDDDDDDDENNNVGNNHDRHNSKNNKAIRSLIREKRLKKKLNKKIHSINILKTRLRNKDEKICEYQVNYQIEINRIKGLIEEIEQNPNRNLSGIEGKSRVEQDQEIEKIRLEKMVRLLLLIQADQASYINQLETQTLSLESQIKSLEASMFPV